MKYPVLIPEPRIREQEDHTYILTAGSYLVLDPACSMKVQQQARLFLEEAESYLGFRLNLTRGNKRAGDFSVSPAECGEESYRLSVSEQGIQLCGDDSGIWYGFQTLLQMMQQCGPVLPVITIEDQPKLKNRGFYFDCTRGRVPKLSWLKQLADRMAFYKLNQLQLYIEHTYLFRDMPELWRDDTPLTAEEIMELDEYCLLRGIELVPSLADFGHLYKLLNTDSYHHLCELEGKADLPFSLIGRMQHHTIDISSPESIRLMKEMLWEFMQLFSSRKFNMCADETFDLGKGRSAELVKQKGKSHAYIDYVKELASFLIECGRTPMFWGDIILEFPEMIRELPEGTICLNWGYAPDQTDENTRKMAEAGALQYCCSGSCAWNHLIPQYTSAYNNISRLSSYAVRYEAEGLLNTDWGDFLHVNHPDFSLIPMIYGAAFSWNPEIPSIEEINRRIALLAFRDRSQRLVQILATMQDQEAFTWAAACYYYELCTGKAEDPAFHQFHMLEELAAYQDVETKNKQLESMIRELYQTIPEVDPSMREQVIRYIHAAEGIRLMNLTGYLAASEQGIPVPGDAGKNTEVLAAQMERWLYEYKKYYRKVSQESELARIGDIFCWYADRLRRAKTAENATTQL